MLVGEIEFSLGPLIWIASGVKNKKRHNQQYYNNFFYIVYHIKYSRIVKYQYTYNQIIV